MQTTFELQEQPEKLSRSKRALSAIGGVLCAGAGVAIMKYIPYDIHDSMAFQPLLASGLLISGGILEYQAATGEAFSTPQAEDSEQR